MILQYSDAILLQEKFWHGTWVPKCGLLRHERRLLIIYISKGTEKNCYEIPGQSSNTRERKETAPRWATNQAGFMSMGHHYLPQYYLKGFTETNDNMLWAYEKKTGRKFNTQIKSLANITDFYSQETEQYLANDIEGPANAVLDKIRSRNLINDDDKNAFAEYMAVMWKRVPRAKEDLKKMAPRLADGIAKKLSGDLDHIIAEETQKTEFIEKRRKEIDDILSIYATNPPKDIWLENIPPGRTPRIVEAMKAMTWTFWEFDEQPVFLTCDNPVFYFTGMGVGRKDSEISFPISSQVVLWATWRADLPRNFIKASTQIVKEMNRRTVHNASRFVFHSRNEHWMVPFVKKKNWKLNRIA